MFLAVSPEGVLSDVISLDVNAAGDGPAGPDYWAKVPSPLASARLAAASTVANAPPDSGGLAAAFGGLVDGGDWNPTAHGKAA